MEVIKCPNCEEVGIFDDFFRWIPDDNGHPTIEEMRCLECLCSNYSITYEEDGQEKENEVVLLDEFEFVEFDSLSDKKKLELTKRHEEITYVPPTISTDGLPF